MNESLMGVWVYLAASPLLWLAVTMLAYLAAQWLSARSGRHPLCNPVPIAIIIMCTLLIATRTPYPRYFEGAQFVHFLLGPTTVALAVPLYYNAARIRAVGLPLLAGLLAGSLTAIVAAVGTAWLLGGSRATLLSMAPKSVTMPVALGFAEKIGGLPSLAAALVMLTGVVGVIAGPPLLERLGIVEDEVKGFALGVAAHGIGTARAFQISTVAGAFAGLAIGINAVLTTLLVPLLLDLLPR